MLYSSAILVVVKEVKDFLAAARSTSTLAPRRVETSDPTELDEKYLVTELGWTGVDAPTSTVGSTTEGVGRQPFARPKGPGRKR